MKIDGNTPDYTRKFWAKAQPYRQKGPESIHLLEHHLADVGACFEALLEQPTLRQRFARSGGLGSLDDAVAARLSLFAALHDIGKVNVGFQTLIWRDEDLPPGQRRPLRSGHYRELVPVLQSEDSNTADWFFNNLGWWWDAVETWDDCGGETVCALFVAALSHHGQPLQLEGGQNRNPSLWSQYGSLTPADEVRRIGELARQWFPAALAKDAPPLPSPPAFQHHFLGLCTLADWIGSNELWFPFCGEPRGDYMAQARQQARKAVREIGLDITAQREQLSAVPGFSGLFPQIDGEPNAIQQAASDASLREPLVIIESETGSGKTEAALWRFAKMYEAGLVDGLYFALPTRAAATQLHGRVTQMAERMFPADCRPETILAVPGYVKSGDISGRHLQNYEVWWDDEADTAARNRRWAAESSKRYLAAQIAVGTVDQAMMAALKVKHAHMRAASLSRNLLVVDEVHASDAYMRRIIKALLDAHLGAGGYALLMSATLGSAARRQWLSDGQPGVDEAPPLAEAIAVPYPSISARAASGGENIAAAGANNQEKTVSISSKPLILNFGEVAEMAMMAARAGAKVLVIRNTVTSAIATQEALELAAGDDRHLLFSLHGIATLHHSRYSPDDRRLLDGEVERRLGRDRAPGGLVIVGTQTLEQSLDIDADLLITDLCPVDVLLQRIGRLHRHRRHDRPSGYEAPVCTVLTPESEDLSPMLRGRTNRTGLGPSGFVYEDLRVLEATRRLIAKFSQWSIPAMNRMLVERATHPAALKAIAKELGADWQSHSKNIMGGQLGEGLTADNAVIRRDKSFFNDNRDILFGSSEERIRPRLGDEGYEVKFDPQPASPFDTSRPIEAMTIGSHLLRGAAPEEDTLTPAEAEGGFTFAIGEQRFHYDRHGLRREG